MGANEINEKTRVQLFAVIGALPFLIGGIIWLTTIDAKASTAEEKIKGVLELLIDVRERVIRIEEAQKQRGKQ